MNNKLFGIDFGTGGCKATVIDLEGMVCATAFEEYPTEHRHPKWSEQQPQLWLDAFINTVNNCRHQLNNDFSGLLGIAITASTHNAVLLDGNGDIIRNCIMWNDQRSGEQCERLAEDYGKRIFEIGMAMPTPTWTLPQLMWVKENEPENYEKISRLMFTKDYIRSFVTGDFCTDIVDAQGSLLFDAANGEWSKELCDMISLPIDVLPPVKPSKEIIGYVRKSIAELTGLPEGVPVIAGCSDTAAEDFGAGAVKSGQIIVKMATAGNVNVITDKSNPHPKTYTYPYSVHGMWYTVTGTNTCAASYRWLRDSLYSAEKGICDAKGEDVYLMMNEDAVKSEVGSRGLIFHPYLLGERCPYFNSNARADFFGVNMMHTKCDFSRAVLEGVAFSLYDCFLVLADFNKNIEDIRIIGGGGKTPIWAQIVSDVFGLELKYPQNAESSFGGALLAGVGVGVFENELAAAEKCVKIERIYKPNMENHEKYKKYFEIYQDVVAASEPIWEKLNKISDK
ncbi:MAG: xylulokinase [Clostridia bacterium]|nr:xylulokinase [Clostridia bacterium]